MKTAKDYQTILTQFTDGPSLLEKAIEGLSETDLDCAPSTGGWSIREIIHHLSDGDDIWKSCIKMALGNENAEFHLEWYWTYPQTHWSSSWAYATRPTRTSLDLLKANRAHLSELLSQIPDGWTRTATLREPNGKITQVTVVFIIEMQTRHILHHLSRIEEIRREHKV